jgi:hypothetical protein
MWPRPSVPPISRAAPTPPTRTPSPAGQRDDAVGDRELAAAHASGSWLGAGPAALDEWRDHEHSLVAATRSGRGRVHVADVASLPPSRTPAVAWAPIAVSPLEELQALRDAELRLLADAIGEHLACELIGRVHDLRARQDELAARH